MDRKQSSFTQVSELEDSDFIPSFGMNTNKKISKADFFDQIKDETQIFIYPTIEQLQAANLVADPDWPIYVRVEETEYRLYKITSLVAGANDIPLDNGTTATFQEEYSEIGFVVGPSPSVDGAVALFDGESGTQLKNGPVMGVIGKNIASLDSADDTSFVKINPDESVSLRNTAQFRTDLSISNVDNTSDEDKPISDATQNALDGKVSGPSSSVNEQVALFDGITGKLIKAGQTLADIFDGWLVQLYNIFPRTINTYADIATTTMQIGQVVYLKQHTSGGKGGGEFIGVSSVGLVANTGTISSTATAGVFARRSGTLSEIKASWFGCILDGVADDTVQMQAAIDYCLPQVPNNIPPIKLVVDGLAKITSQLFIDKPVDVITSIFRVQGLGKKSGFVQSTGFTMFGSRYPYGPAGGIYTASPVTDFTWFDNITFENTIESASGFVFDEKFLRLTFNECRFIGIRGGSGVNFWQSIHFFGCHFRKNNGEFLENKDGYDIRFDNSCGFESAGKGWKFTGKVLGLSCDNVLCQNSTAPLSNIFQAFGVTIKSPYFEANTGQPVVFGAGNSEGIHIEGGTWAGTAAQEADVNFYMINLGAARHATVTGVYTACNLIDNSTSSPLAVVATPGCSVPVNRLISKNPIASNPSLAANAAGTQADATKIVSLHNTIAPGAVANASIIMPSSLLVQSVGIISVYNPNAVAIRVYPAVGERFSGLAANAPFVLAAMTTKYFANGLADYWDVI